MIGRSAVSPRKIPVKMRSRFDGCRSLSGEIRMHNVRGGSRRLEADAQALFATSARSLRLYSGLSRELRGATYI